MAEDFFIAKYSIKKETFCVLQYLFLDPVFLFSLIPCPLHRLVLPLLNLIQALF